MKLEDAIKTIKSIIYDNKGNSMDYIDISFSQSKEDIGAEEFIQAIETVLQALENSNIKDVGNITATQYVKIQREGYLRGRKEEQEKARECILRLQENSIPKKEIEDLKSKYEKKYEKHNAVATKQFEEVGTRDCFDNELAIRDLGVIRACEELLEDK